MLPTVQAGRLPRASPGVQHCWTSPDCQVLSRPYTGCCLPCAGKAALAAAAEGAPPGALPAADEAEPPPAKKGRKGKKGAKAAAAAEHRAQEEAAAKGRINLHEGEAWPGIRIWQSTKKLGDLALR